MYPSIALDSPVCAHTSGTRAHPGLPQIVDTHFPPPVPTAPAEPPRLGNSTLGECMATCARRYLADLDGTPCREGLYARLLREVEAPLLREVLAWSGGNQCRAAEVLGIHRATLRKKLRELGIV